MIKLEKAGLVDNQLDTGHCYRAQKLKDINHHLNTSMAHKPTPTGIDRFIRNGRLQTFPKSATTVCWCWNILLTCSNLTNSTRKSRLTSN